MTISQFIKQETGLTNYKLAQLLKDVCSKQQVYDVMNDKTQPTVKMFFNICKQFKISKQSISVFYENYLEQF